MSGYIDPNSEEYKKERREELIQECKEYITDCEYIVKHLELNTDLSIMITVKGVSIGITDGFGGEVIDLLKSQIQEAQKCIDGKPNKYE